MKAFYTRGLFLFAALCCSLASFATDYYVDALNGNNANNGLTSTTAFKTLSRVSYSSVTFAPGDVVYLMDGTYGTTDLANVQSQFAVLAITQSGSATSPITFRNLPGHTPLIQFNNWHGIYLQAAYILIEGIRIRGNASVINLAEALDQPSGCQRPTESPLGKFNGNGIYMDPGGAVIPHHITVRNCEIFEVSGLGLGGTKNDYVTIEGNKVYGNAKYSRYGTSGISFLHLTDFDANTSSFRNIIRNNIVYDNEMLVPWYSGSCRGFTDGNGIIIDDANNGQGGGSGVRYTGKTLIENNIVYNNGGRGIHVFVTSNVTVIHNTVYQNNKTSQINDGEITVMSSAASQAEGNRVFNNVMMARPGKRLNSVNNQGNGALQENNNLMYGSGLWGYFSDRDIMALPQFEDTLTLDLRLRNTSPGIDAGVRTAADGVAKDILGTSRPFRTFPDMGAYEHTGTLPVRPSFSAGNLAVLRVGQGSTYVTTQTQSVDVVEYTMAGSPTGFTVPLSTGTIPFSIGAVATTAPTGNFPSDGQLTRSRDGRYLMAMGYELAIGTDSASNWRNSFKRLARLNHVGEIDMTTRIAASQFGTFGAFVRNAASDFGASFWVSASQNFRTVNLWGSNSTLVTAGQATRSVRRLGDSVYQINFNEIASVSGVRRPLTGTSEGNQSQDFVVFDLDPNVSYGNTGWDVLYRSEFDWGLRKYFFNGNVWVPAGTYNAGAAGAASGLGRGFNSLTSQLNADGKPEIYGIQGLGENNRVVRVVDNSAYNVNWATATGAAAPSQFTVANSGAGYSFRGVAFTPTQFGLTSLSTIILPVSIASIQGYLVGNDGLIQWRTSMEAGLKEYRVERSVDGTTFAPIGTVQAENSARGASYSYTDRGLAAGIHYYRLRAVDFDGKQTLSRIVSIKNLGSSSSALQVFPNPVASNLTVTYPVARAAAVLRILDVSGRELQRLSLPVGSRQTELNVAGLVHGQYTIVVRNGEQTMVTKFIK